jgi:uracil-DNA glycosylase family 4
MLPRPIECAGCCLNDKAAGFSNPEGKGTIPLLIVGESLGEHEARAGLPFRPEAPAGSILERVFRMCKFDRQQFRIANTIQCQPPRNWLEGAPWEQGAISHCQIHRNRIINEMQPKAILALGGIALRTLTGHVGHHRGILMLRGYPIKALDRDIPVIGGYHPIFLREGKIKWINVLCRDLKHAVAVALGQTHDYCMDIDEAGRFVQYQTRPTLDDARAYANYLRNNHGLLVNLDIETDPSLLAEEDVDEDVDMAMQQPVTQVQFSTRIGHAICMPWDLDFIPIIRDILKMPHVKSGHNAWRFDLPRLRREGLFINGVVHDTRWMWHHMQPDLPAHLQFVSSFYGMPFPWKHIASYNDEFYGCCDADALSRIMDKLPEQMRKRGVWSSYERHMLGMDRYLIELSEHGIPIDDAERGELAIAISKSRDQVKEQLQTMVPEELKPIHPKEGYKRPPADKTGLVQRDFPELIVTGQPGMFEVNNEPQMVSRWCRVEPFNPNSSDQVIEYLKYQMAYSKKKGYRVPKKWREDKDTTEEIELLKVIRATKDPVLPLVLEVRGFQKMLSTYVEGWAPDSGGFVHPTYEHGTAVGQLNSKNPNGQNFPIRKELAKKMRQMIRAKAGHKIVELDFKSFHAVTLAFEAHSANWMRLSRSDIHSFVTAHFLHLPERDQLLDWADDALIDYLAWVKSKYRDTRDSKAKHAILGVGNGMGYRKLYRQYSEYFEREGEAKTLHDTIKGIFPEVFKYQNDRRMEAHQNTFLMTRFGYIRWFFDVMHYDPKSRELVPGNDSEAAVAFHHPNDAFGHMNEQMLWMGVNGLHRKYGWCNNLHDALQFHCPTELVEECIDTMRNHMTMRSPVLVDGVTAPDGLYVDVEAKVGDDWQHMQTVEVPAPTGVRLAGPEGKAELVETRWEPIPVEEKPLAEITPRWRPGTVEDDTLIPF